MHEANLKEGMVSCAGSKFKVLKAYKKEATVLVIQRLHSTKLSKRGHQIIFMAFPFGSELTPGIKLCSFLIELNLLINKEGKLFLG